MQALWDRARTKTQKQFEYLPLDQRTRSIRLLRVFPRKRRDDLLQCEMHHADVESKYTCLSYVWGSPEPTQQIKVNGKLMRIRQNLLEFLNQASKSNP